VSWTHLARLAVLVVFTASTQSVPILEAVEALASLHSDAHHHDGSGCVDPCADGSACGDGCTCMCCPGHGPIAVVPAPDLTLAHRPVGERAWPHRDALLPTLLPKGIFHPPR